MQLPGKEFIDFLLPRFCPCCGTKLLPSEPPVCPQCLSKIQEASPARISSEFNLKFAAADVISGFISLFVFEKDKELQKVIHAMKYGRKFLLGVFLGELLGSKIKREFSHLDIDLAVPVPLHHLRKAERRFNQSYYIAKGVSTITGIGLNNTLLKRKSYTATQTTMKISERESNVRNAFITKRSLKGETILLVDDVITTGATISECGKTLLTAGAGRIYAASAAIAD
jgi:ComF family protein